MQEKKEKRSDQNFYTLLKKLDDAEEGLIDLSDDDFNELFGDIKKKVDSIKHVITKLEAESFRLKNIVEQFSKRKSSIDKAQKRLEEWALYSMKKNQMDYLEGELYTVKIKKSQAVQILQDPDSKSFMEIGRQFKGIITRVYKWNKNQLRDALKSENYKLVEKYAELKFNEKASFDLKKGEK